MVSPGLVCLQVSCLASRGERVAVLACPSWLQTAVLFAPGA